eukprot:1531782-Lingulodinium_polyedra.AAC.1
MPPPPSSPGTRAPCAPVRATADAEALLLPAVSCRLTQGPSRCWTTNSMRDPSWPQAYRNA